MGKATVSLLVAFFFGDRVARECLSLFSSWRTGNYTLVPLSVIGRFAR
jgi:hypothetical protein